MNAHQHFVEAVPAHAAAPGGQPIPEGFQLAGPCVTHASDVCGFGRAHFSPTAALSLGYQEISARFGFERRARDPEVLSEGRIDDMELSALFADQRREVRDLPMHDRRYRDRLMRL